MEYSLNGNWGNRNDDDFRYQIAFDFVAQIERIMKAERISRSALATRLGVSKGRVSQFLNKPGNLKLESAVQYVRALNRKVAIVTYDDSDPTNANGPIPPDVFVTCWKRAGNPADMFSAEGFTAASTNAGSWPNLILVHHHHNWIRDAEVEAEAETETAPDAFVRCRIEDQMYAGTNPI